MSSTLPSFQPDNLSPTVEQAGTVPDNAAKSLARSASFDAAGSEQGAELCAIATSNTSQHLLHMAGTYIYHSHHDRG